MLKEDSISTDAAADFDYFEDDGPDLTCPNCSGTGGEPYDDFCTPCEECDGEGYRWWL